MEFSGKEQVISKYIDWKCRWLQRSQNKNVGKSESGVFVYLVSRLSMRIPGDVPVFSYSAHTTRLRFELPLARTL
jgi:hypothetical protein